MRMAEAWPLPSKAAWQKWFGREHQWPGLAFPATKCQLCSDPRLLKWSVLKYVLMLAGRPKFRKASQSGGGRRQVTPSRCDGLTRPVCCRWRSRHRCDGGGLRDELLNGEIFYSPTESQVTIESWRRRYNTLRSHGSLEDKPPISKVFVSATSARTVPQP